MHATFGQISSDLNVAPPLRAIFPTPEAQTAAAAPPAWEEGGRYGEQQRRSPTTLAAILIAHAALLWGLVALEVVPVAPARSKPIVVTLVPEPVAPPPAPAQPEPEQVAPAAPRIVAPPPLVQVAAPPPPVVTVDAPPPPAVEVVAIAAAPPGPPASVVPPDASAASLNNPAPRYPLESRRKREEGTVRLRVLVSVEGGVKEIAVARSSGFDRLDKAALETVRRWRFRPGTQAGVAVEAIGFLSIPFRLSA